MATSIVTIDAPDKVVTCDGQGRAQQLFNVRNTSGNPLTVGAKVLVDAPAKAEWLTVDAPAEQELGDGVLTQIPVKVKVPDDCAPGRYTYRLLVYSTRKSGEEFTEGGTVAVEVPTREAPPPPPPPKPFPWWIVALVAVVLIGGGAAWLFWPSNVTVPEVVGKPIDQARSQLEAVGLQVFEPVAVKPSRDQAPDNVLEQVPEKDAKVAKGTAIHLTVAETPKVKVPSLRGSRLAAALQQLSKAGLALGEVNEKGDKDKPVGTVLEQSPNQNVEVDEGTKVNLTVAKEPGKGLVLDPEQLKAIRELQTQRFKIPAQLFRTVPPEGSQ